MTFLPLDLLYASGFGFLGAILITLVGFPFWKKWGMEGITDWQVNSVMVSKLLRKSNSGNPPGLSWIIASICSHGVAAAITLRLLLPIFFWSLPISKMSILADSVIYSFILWSIFIVLGRGTFESEGGIRTTNRGILSSLLCLVIYGIVLGTFLPLTFP
jgi:hypothetical protein